MCLRGCATSPPPACLTNSAGERKFPWHTHMILTSSPFPYLYKIPSILLPLGPFPFVNTQGMSSIEFVPICFPIMFWEGWDFLDGFSTSALELLPTFSFLLAPTPTASWLNRSCADWLLAGLASPQLLDPVISANYTIKSCFS